MGLYFMRFDQMPPANSNPAATKHDTQSLKLEVMEQRNRLIHVERTVNSLGEAMTGLDGKMDTVVNALTGITTRQELIRPTDWLKVLGAAVAAVSIFSAAVGGITYIVKAFGEAERVAIRKDIEFLALRVDRGWGIGGTTIMQKSTP